MPGQPSGRAYGRCGPMTALAHPFGWHLNIFWTVAIPALLIAYLLATRAEEYRATRRQRICFGLGVVALVVAFMWPLGDLAARWSLLALVAQRLLLMLAVPPLLVLGTPRPLLVWLTRPARRRCRPAPGHQARTGGRVRHRGRRGDVDHRRGQPGRPLGGCPRGDPDRGPALGLRPLGACPHRTAGRETSLRRRARGAT